MKAHQNSLKQILSLQKFKLEPDQIAEVYPRAYALPQFFTHNLQSESRVVKYFQGPYALMGSFYYQLMKLSLQIESEGVNYRELIFNKFVKFDLFGEGELEDQIFTDFQYRKFMKDFIELVQKQDIPSFEKNVEKYPIIDQILVKLFKIILPLPMLLQLENEKGEPNHIARQILDFLCEQFSITVTQIGKCCFKFEESDTFLYFQSTREVFLAFNEIYVQDKSGSTSFKSCFQCGDENSFLSKHHTQTKPSHLKSSKESQRIWIQTKDLPLRTHYGEHKQKQDDITYCGSSRGTSPLQVQQMSQPFKSLSSFLNKDSEVTKPKKQQLYEQFTNSLILKQMPARESEKIREIKNKYAKQKRSSIRSFI